MAGLRATVAAKKFDELAVKGGDPQAFIDLLDQMGGSEKAAAYNWPENMERGNSSTWRRYRKMAEQLLEEGPPPEEAPAKTGPLADLREQLEADAEDLREQPPPQAPEELVERVGAVVQEQAEEDDLLHTDEVRKPDLPASAYEEDIPREFRGGLEGPDLPSLPSKPTAQQLFDYYLAATDLEEYVHEVRLRVVEGKRYAVVLPITDVHVGKQACNFPAFVALRQWTAERAGYYTIAFHDWTNCPTIKSPEGPDLGRQVLTVRQSIDVLAKAVEIDRDKTILLSPGNHEHRIYRDTGQDLCPMDWIAQQTGVAYMSQAGPLICHVGTQTYVLYLAPGVGGGQTIGYLWAKLERFHQRNLVDAVLAGHDHLRAAMEDARMGIHPTEDGRHTWGPQSIHMIHAGSFVRYFPGEFARERNMRVPVSGSVAVRLYADRHDIHPRV